MIKNNLVLEDLQYNGLMIYQSTNGYRFTSDSVHLANFVKVKKGGNLLDLCSGSGVIGILASAKNIVKHTYFVEIQESLADMCKMSIDYNKLTDMTIYNKDVKGISKEFTNINIDTIVCNPPYFVTNARNDNSEIAIARHEVLIKIEDIIKESSKILKDKGKLYLCIRSSRLAEVMYLMKKYLIEPKELKIITENKTDQVVLIKGIKMGEVGLTIQV